jgi:hypothetical protein
MKSFAIAVFAVVVISGSTQAAEPLRSSLQAGEKVTAIFEPLNVTGPYAGDPHCLICENGVNPVAMVFARQKSPSLMKLVAGLDAAAAKHRSEQLGAFVVFLSEAEGLADQLKAAAKQNSLKEVILATDAPAGPEGFSVAKEADVTVVLYRDFAVASNHAFRKGELTDERVEQVLADLPKILKSK